MQAFSRRTTGDGGRQRSRVPLSRRFTYRYVFAVAVFAMIAVASKVVIDASSHKIDGLSRQTAAAAEQANRVVQIVTLANNVAFPEGKDADQVNRDASTLKNKSQTLIQVQEGLINGDAAIGLPATPLTPELDALYREPANLRDTIKKIGDSGSALADLPGSADAKVRGDLYTTITTNQDEALDGLGTAVNYYNDHQAAEVKAQTSNTQVILGLSLFSAVLMLFLVFRPMARNIHLETSQLEDAERIHRENNERQTFRNELSQALEVTDSEGEVLAAVGRAFNTVIPENKVELLLTDSSQSHLRRAQVSPTQGACDCPVDSPLGCAAIRRGQTVVYESSRMLNVCPKLPEHEQGVCSAVCVPVMFMGQALGVLHTVGPDGHPPSHTEIERLSVLASETGNRLGIMRNTQATELQASTDGLTGLYNRRELETRTRALLLDNQPFSIAMADLDKFKNLNDTHGHEAGDRALRLFASVLRTGLRPEDVSARYGGEEFVILLPSTTIREAHAALSRLQTSLAAELSKAGSIPFTASWGLTDHAAGSSFDEIVSVADTMLYGAKRAGRDCIMVDREAALRAGMQPDAEADDGEAGYEMEEEPLVQIDMDRLDPETAGQSHD
jgi:diguanylate cyclase (GGDEF)-like protein